MKENTGRSFFRDGKWIGKYMYYTLHLWHAPLIWNEFWHIWGPYTYPGFLWTFHPQLLRDHITPVYTKPIHIYAVDNKMFRFGWFRLTYCQDHIITQYYQIIITETSACENYYFSIKSNVLIHEYMRLLFNYPFTGKTKARKRTCIV